jgi:hypothetical protein
LPGPDELMNGVLLRLPLTHSFLTTLYSRWLLEDPDPSAKWCQSEIKLIYKDGDENDPANFRPILLTTVTTVVALLRFIIRFWQIG